MDELTREFHRRLKNRKSAGGGGGVGLATDAIEDVKGGIRDAGQLTLAQEVLDAIVGQLKDRVPQLEGLPPVVTRALAALGLNALMRHYGDALPFDGSVREVLEGVVQRTTTAAFLPLFTDLKLFDVLRGAVGSVTGAVAATARGE